MNQFKRFFIMAFCACMAICIPSGAATPKTAVSSNDNLTMLLGTYTAGSNSKGIYVYRFNQQNGVSKYVSYVSAKNPSFLVASADNRFAYSVSEFGDGTATCNAFKLNKASGKLSFINSQLTGKQSKGGEDPCNITTNGKFVITSNYSGGDVSVFPIAKDGSLLPQNQHLSYNENGKSSAVSHIHCARFTPDGKYMLVNDLGHDCIYRLNVNSKADYRNKQLLLSNGKVAYNGAKGLGPRHIVFSDNGKFAYLITELGDVVVTFSYQAGTLKEIQSQPAYDGGGHGSADIHLSPDGKFLYTSHRLKKEGLSILSVNQTTGKITKVGYQLTGKHPRNFAITPNGKYVLVGCRDDNKIEVYLRNAKTGLLTLTKQSIEIGKPVCIQFLK